MSRHVYAALLGSFLITTPLASGAAWFTEDDKAADCVNAASATTYETAFAPDEHVADLIIRNIAAAKKSIHVASRTFSSKPVAEALIAAGRSGKDIKVVVDKQNNSNGYTAALFMQTMDYPPRLSGIDLRMSFMVIDDKDVIIGGVSTVPEVRDEKRNTMGVLVIHNAPDLAKRYAAVWQKTWDGGTAMPSK